MKLHKRIRRNLRQGFSLAEMMVVIVIIGLLATLVVPNVVAKLFTGQVGKAKADITTISSALEEFTILNQGTYPETLEALVTPDENGNTILNSDRVPVDPWGNEYQYEPPSGGQTFRVFTLGQDGAPGGEGKDRDFDQIDIRNGNI